MTQQYTEGFDGNTIIQCYGGGKSVPDQMKSQVLIDPADISNFF